MSDLRQASREFRLEFIEIYKNSPCLWQIKSKDYSDRNKKDLAYAELVKKYKEIDPKADRSTVVKKINSFRTVYRKELNKINNSLKSGAGADEVYKPNLWYFENLHFLNDVEPARISKSTMDETEGENMDQVTKMVKTIVKSVFVVVLGIFLALVYEKLTLFTSPPPKVPLQWWGIGKEGKSDTTIKPFKINVPKEVIADLQQRLNMVRPFHPPLEGVAFQYGFNTNYLKTVLEFWKNKYSWTDRQVYLNSFPQFTTEVAGLKLHFIHVKPAATKPGVKVIPLLLVHGWPGSLVEFYEILPLLTTPRPGENFVFEVIAPSIPGYGFSQGAAKPGLGVAQVAVIFDKLMQQLGFDKYFAQGGDWGAIIMTAVSQLFPNRVRGLHTNMCNLDFNGNVMARLLLGSVFPSLIVESHEEKLTYPLSKVLLYLIEESGYMHLQATKPDTIGVALQESPIGLAAYILEKFSTWTDPKFKQLPDGGLQKKYDLTNLLDNVMIYWVSNSTTTSMRLYSETLSFEQKKIGLDNVPVNVPTVCARFPHELLTLPKSVLKLKYKNLIQVTDMKEGGHFAAFEQPKLLADDVWQAVKLMLENENKPKQ